MKSLIKRLLLLVVSLILTACSSSFFSRQNPSPATSCDIAVRDLTEREKQEITELQRNIERGPLYALSLARGQLAKCTAKQDAGVIHLEYNFRGGGWLRVKRDARIEYSDQEVRFGSPLDEEPKAILKRVETSAFGKEGCGIDWNQAEKQPAEGGSQEIETIFRGDTCNCQARVRSNARGLTAGLSFRSTC